MYFDKGIVEPELAVLDQHHRGDDRDRLRHRIQPKDRIRRHRPLASDVAHTETFEIAGTPCCWISMTAPGICRPPSRCGNSRRRARVLRAKSSPRRQARDSARPLSGHRAGEPQRPEARAPPKAARRRTKPSVLHRFIDQPLHRRLDALALRRRLLQQHEEHVLLAVDHEIAAAGAVPFQFAETSPAAAAWRCRDRCARQSRARSRSRRRGNKR